MIKENFNYNSVELHNFDTDFFRMLKKTDEIY